MDLHEKIRKARENKGFNRKYMAQCIGVDERTYEKLENKDRDPHLSEVLKVAAILDLTIQDLLLGEPKLVFEYPTILPANEKLVLLLEEMKILYEAHIKALKDTIQDKETIITQLKAVKK